MILGIGTDIADIGRIAKTIGEQGERFLERCFAPEERAYVEGKYGDDPALRAAGYAKRWAAKEACAKALGLGIRDGIFLKDIVILNDSAGKPALDLRGGAKDRLTRLAPGGMTVTAHVSLSDEPPMALAFVMIVAG
jgi:holo-[acyl-carrier protein] synthase